jgi:hypothetical protein
MKSLKYKDQDGSPDTTSPFVTALPEFPCSVEPWLVSVFEEPAAIIYEINDMGGN